MQGALFSTQKNCPVAVSNGFAELTPFRMMPPKGAVTAAAVLFCGFGTPRYCIVVVFGVTMVWALAVTIASITIITRQNKLRAESV
jgi:hypothetical protein